ncbi:hypothetical protein KC222_04365 [Cedecea davisae]|uniref:Uncharacterized protein n=1 Tax=Cedecea davisae TaxID=158484 RepID=A0ABS6DDN2_9ENTR|nr:hypothetical protein [Cedecea davisae]MBU4681243.1 hypothetical protein [Cedecea davisae]MBU4686321.1 hypothetical protein [Cedecea davisae]
MNNLSNADLTAILAAADAVISAMAGENDDVHPDNTSKMIALWDDLNDRQAPPAVVKAMARELLALREAGKEPVAYMYRDRLHKDARFSYESKLGNWSPEDISEYEITETKLYAAPQLPAVPEYPELLPCPVFLEPGFRFGKGVPTSSMLGALKRRAEHQAELDAMSPEAKAEYDASIKRLKSVLMPDGWVMVPEVPTEDMVINGFESDPDIGLGGDIDAQEAYEAMSGCQQAAHRAKLCWSAMIAAAPKPEPEPEPEPEPAAKK